MTRRLRHLVDQVTKLSGDGPVPFVALENIRSRTGSLLPDAELPVRPPDPSGMTGFRAGDVLFGKLRPYLAKSWRADRAGACSTELIVMRPRPEVDDRWLAYLAQSDLLVEWAVATSEGVKMPRTSWEKLRQLTVAAPSLAAQRFVSDYLDVETGRIDELIGRKRDLIELLAIRRSSFVAAIVATQPEASPRADLPWLTAVPSSWPSVPLGLLADVFNGSTPQGFLDDAGDIPWTTSGEIDQGMITVPTAYISEAARRAHGLRVAPAGSIVVGLVGQGRTRGLSAQLALSTTLNQNLAAICPRGGQLVSSYVGVLLGLAYEDLRNGGRGGNQAALNCEMLRAYRIPVAPRDAQARLVDQVASQRTRDDATAALLARSLDLLLERRQSIITGAVTGELRIPGVAA